MTYTDYEIVKLEELQTQQHVYVAIIKTQEQTHRVKILSQPLHSLVVTHYSDRIFKQQVHPYDTEDNINLNFDKDDMTFNIHDYMVIPINNDELVKVLQHLITIQFNKSLLNQVIMLNALERLISKEKG